MSKKLAVPSVLHLARLWDPDEAKIKDALLRLHRSSPPFSYGPLLRMVRSVLALKEDPASVEHLIQQSGASNLAKEQYLQIAPLLVEKFRGERIDQVIEVTPRNYPISRNLRIPFAPPMFYVSGGQLLVPVFLFWKTNPLTDQQLVLAATILSALVTQEPDADRNSLRLLDFSSPSTKGVRRLREVALGDLPLLSMNELTEMLVIFSRGYEAARATLATEYLPVDTPAEHDRPSPSDQRDFFL